MLEYELDRCGVIQEMKEKVHSQAVYIIYNPPSSLNKRLKHQPLFSHVGPPSSQISLP